MNAKYFSILALFTLTTIGAQAQEDSTQLQFKISANYNSNLNYYGRTDSLSSSGFFPMAEIWTPSGWYLNAAPIFVHNRVQSFEYAGTIATLGYQNFSENWLRHFYLLKPFYTETAQLVQSALKMQTGFSISNLNKVANLTFGADLKFSNKIDVGATAGIDHIIRFETKKASVWVIDPSIYFYAGTQQFSKTYTTQKSRGLLFPPTQEEETKNVNKFNILAYEFSVPVFYTKGKMQLSAIPAYMVPQNLLTVEGRPDLSETGEKTLYLTLGAKYSF